MFRAILFTGWCLFGFLALTASLQARSGVDPTSGIQIQPPEAGVLLGPAIENTTTQIRYRVRNTDQKPADAVLITVEVTDGQGAVETLMQQQMALSGDETIVIRQPWTPTRPGTWSLRIDVQSRQLHSHYQEEVAVAPLDLPSAMQAISAFGITPPWFVFSGLAMLMAVAFLTVGYTLYTISHYEP